MNEGGRIELSVREIRQLFHPLDHSPLYDREFDAHFARLADHRSLTLNRLFARGRASLGIGLLFLAAMLLLAEAVSRIQSPIAPLLRESLLIAGWVAMWRPMEIFLYDWWPIRSDRKLYERLAAMPVEILQGTGVGERTQ